MNDSASDMLNGAVVQTYFQKGLGLKAEVLPVLARSYKSPVVETMKALGYSAIAGDLHISLACEFGFCYGVDRAVEYAYETRHRFPDRRVFLSGQIIHNHDVNRRLQHYHEETRATASQTLGHPGAHYLCVRDVREAGVLCAWLRGEITTAAFLETFSAAVSPAFDPERDLQGIGLANQTTMLMGETLAVQELISRRDARSVWRRRARRSVPRIRHHLLGHGRTARTRSARCSRPAGST